MKWPEAFALRNSTAETVVNCLIDLTSRVGVPQEILTDNGTNFVSKVVKQFCQTTGVHQIRTSPYHPETDGMVECFNSTLKRLLRKLTQNDKVEWDKCLPFYCGRIVERCMPQQGFPLTSYFLAEK